MLLELLCSFFFLFSTTKTHSSLDIWGTVTLNILQKGILNMFIRIFLLEPSNYASWNSLLVCQFANYLINKIIVLRNQQLVKFYENNNLGLGDRQKIFQKIGFIVGWLFFLKHPVVQMLKIATILNPFCINV